MSSAYMSVNQDGSEILSTNCPIKDQVDGQGFWIVENPLADESWELLTGTCENILGEKLSWEDEPVHLEQDYESLSYLLVKNNVRHFKPVLDNAFSIDFNSSKALEFYKKCKEDKNVPFDVILEVYGSFENLREKGDINVLSKEVSDKGIPLYIPWDNLKNHTATFGA